MVHSNLKTQSLYLHTTSGEGLPSRCGWAGSEFTVTGAGEATTTATITSVVAWGALAAHNVIAMPKIDGVANVSFERVSSSSRFVPKYVVKCIFSSERASERGASWKMNSGSPRAFGVGLRGEARGLKIDID